MPQKPMVLVVDDTESVRKLLAADLRQDGRFVVEQAGTANEGLKIAAKPDCAVVILDMMLPDSNGLEFIEKLRAMRQDPPAIIAITAASQTLAPDSIIEGPYRGLVSAVFRKPIDRAKLRETVAFCASA
jgi:CheY-like chemotaxis protein